MKQFFTVLKFELGNYLKKKSFLIGTLVLALIAAVGLSVPTIIDVFKGDNGKKNDTKVEQQADKEQYGIIDASNILGGIEGLNVIFPDKNWNNYKSLDEIKKAVDEEKIKGAVEIVSDKEFTYFVKNKGVSEDSMTEAVSSVLKKVYQKNTISKAGMDYDVIEKIYNEPIASKVQVLGKDSSNNYFYAYILIFVLYMLILVYGQTIAVAVTAEKSNRAMEILVTSTSSTSLISGKVIAGAISSLLQVGVIMASMLISYNLNSTAWNGKLDFIFKIPADIIVVFVLFGLTGYILYSFVFAALGALVSKSEEVGQSIGPLTLVFVVVFFISIMGLNMGHSMLIKVCSYIPLSSPMCIITRVAMGNMGWIEIGISYILLLGTTILVSIGASKLYRMGTLRYGNPIKLKNALKMLRHKEE
ncbi:ABC-2 type transport system permease protein [Hathewaya proteolytica DSM 3090]|uniref:ABC-2 type transport system permease protein n=1 Tax=Hathewaya proteolytica DSM 3090 TaxID=1121331 RepID=A0A1M6MHA8_9CLOT|nr:ABC transporter permease [Hathewaya proteolytica]SHJ82746.1 ABC-2 type transport system permease protein [Hathewaya proteolytica DSM 3090]